MRVALFPFAQIVRPGSRLRLSIEAPGGNQPFWAFTDLPGTATNEVAHSAGRPSSVALPLVDDAAVASGAPVDAPSCSVPGVTVQLQSLRGQPCRLDQAARRPTGVTAAQAEGAGAVAVSWTPPALWADEVAPDGYQVTISPGGATVTVGGDAVQAVVGSVPTGVPVTATVRATFGGAPGPVSDASPSTTLVPDLGLFVDALWQDFLGRAPTAQERTATVAELTAGTLTRRGAAARLATSEEWIGAIVEGLYQATLGRPGDPSGVAYWTGRIRRGELTVAQVAGRLYASPEYVARFPAGDVGAWVDDLYQEILGRPADAAGRSYWIGVAAARGRFAVARSFVQSPESARRRVDGLYRTLLGRPAEADGLAYWAPIVVARGDIALGTYLAGSPEYLARAQTR